MTYDGDTTTGNGNRDGGTYDNQDRLTALGGATYTYSDNGELASKTASGVTTNYNYDAHGNLRSTSGAVAITYTIDGQNRRVGKTKAGVLQGFVYDGSRIVAELDHTGAELSRFIYATAEHSPDFMIRGGVTYRIVKDHLGSPRLVVNTSNGSIAQRIDYDEWGVATIVGTELNPPFQPFGYAGGLWDRDTGLVRFGARDYDPATARWTSKDAFRFRAGTNFYAYVSSDPINRIDPSGLEGEQLCDGLDGCTGVAPDDGGLPPGGLPPSSPPTSPPPTSPCPEDGDPGEDPPSTAGTCSCQHRDIFESGGKSCQELREEGTCKGPYKGEGDDNASCQKDARAKAPAACRGCLGHCQFRK